MVMTGTGTVRRGLGLERGDDLVERLAVLAVRAVREDDDRVDPALDVGGPGGADRGDGRRVEAGAAGGLQAGDAREELLLPASSSETVGTTTL
jgi:hypothetical protein